MADDVARINMITDEIRIDTFDTFRAEISAYVTTFNCQLNGNLVARLNL